jgi:hypothetical protein
MAFRVESCLRVSNDNLRKIATVTNYDERRRFMSRKLLSVKGIPSHGNDLDLRIDLVLDHILDRHQRPGQ